MLLLGAAINLTNTGGGSGHNRQWQAGYRYGYVKFATKPVSLPSNPTRRIETSCDELNRPILAEGTDYYRNTDFLSGCIAGATKWFHETYD